MSEENENDEQLVPQKKKLSIKQILILGGIVLVLIGGGFFTYTKLFAKPSGGKEGTKEGAKESAKESAKETKPEKEHKAEKVEYKPGEQFLIPMEPIIVNLTDPGRFAKITVQLEVGSKTLEPAMKEKMPLLRDAIIMLLTSKSLESISGPDGKFQLKDEMLARLNQALGKELIRNIYFTEFMVQ